MYRILFCLYLLPLFGYSQIPEPKKDSYVNDYTNTFSEAQICQLNLHLQELERGSTVQMAVLFISELPPGMAIEDYTREVGNTWKVGNHFNGLVYVAVLQERKQRLEVARNLEGDIPDITAGRMIDHLKPYLQKEQYYEAVKLLILQVSEALGAPSTIMMEATSILPPQTESENITETYTWKASDFEKEKAKYDGYGDITIGLIILAFAIFSFWAYRYRKAYKAQHTINGVYIGIGSAYFASTYGSSDGSSGGGSSGFGSFGGGGGGGFSGGSASGSW